MPVTKIRKEQLRLTLQDIIDLNKDLNGSWVVSIPNNNMLGIINNIFQYDFTPTNGFIVSAYSSELVKIADGVFYKSGSNYREYLRDITAGTGISVSGGNVKSISINLSAGNGIKIEGNTISVQYPTALLNEAQTWSGRQTFDAGIEITGNGVIHTNLGLKTTYINTFYEYTVPLRYGSLAPSGNQGLLFQFLGGDQILVFLNGQLLRGRVVENISMNFGNFTWGNDDYIWQFLIERNAFMLCLREQIDSSRDIVTVFGLYKTL